MATPLLITPLPTKQGRYVMTATERAARLRDRRAEAGMRQFNAWVSEGQHPELRALVEYMQKNPNARVSSIALQDAKTGRMSSVRISR